MDTKTKGCELSKTLREFDDVKPNIEASQQQDKFC